MQYWIAGNEIVGELVEGVGLPSGFEIAEGPDLPITSLYWDGGIKEKPPQPTPAHYWDTQNHQWVLTDSETVVSEPTTLEDAIALIQQQCLDYWASRIIGLTAGYPDTEVATWLDFRQESETFLASSNLDNAPNLYREIMLRLFGPEATPEFCQNFRDQSADDAIEITRTFAETILEKNQGLLPELTRLKGLRGWHWEQIGKLAEIENVVNYDYRAE